MNKIQKIQTVAKFMNDNDISCEEMAKLCGVLFITAQNWLRNDVLMIEHNQGIEIFHSKIYTEK